MVSGMKIMAVDLGQVRTGLAVSDPTEQLASPVGTITEKNTDKLLEKVAAARQGTRGAAAGGGASADMDGSRGESARRAETFAASLEKAAALPVVLWDERMTTVSAIGYLNQTDTRGKKRKAVVDTVAATIILQDYLDSRRMRQSE